MTVRLSKANGSSETQRDAIQPRQNVGTTMSSVVFACVLYVRHNPFRPVFVRSNNFEIASMLDPALI
jgi:hypothetical protein